MDPGPATVQALAGLICERVADQEEDGHRDRISFGRWRSPRSWWSAT
jgi:hypothetical protein